ncbi:MAG: uncharacterized protein HW386_900 [Gammaproteobacteria bacterium]|nr:uncharacterized protein [Gammaproteobacteria bacterium]
MAYEDTPKIYLADILPPELRQSIRHRVEEVEVRRGTFHFQLESDFGAYNVATIGLLRERIREILILGNAINHLNSQQDHKLQANRGQLEIRSDRALDIIGQPVHSASNLAGQLAGNLNETLTGPSEAVAREFVYSGGESTDPVAALHKRNVASQWQLDVYSTNPKVQEFLDAMARARSAGTISAGTPALNRQAVKPMRVTDLALDTELSLLLKANGPATLNEINEQVLTGLSISPELRTAFLQHQVFSPRHKFRICHYLNKLAGVANLSAFIAAAGKASEEHEALAYEHLVMMMVHYHLTGHRLRALSPDRTGGRPHMEAISEDNQLLHFLVQDLIYWNENTARRLEAIPVRARESGISNWQLITSGSITEEATSRLRDREFALAQQDTY